MSYYRRNSCRPDFYDYLQRLRARTLREDAEFRERRRCAIAKAAVEEQGVGH